MTTYIYVNLIFSEVEKQLQGNDSNDTHFTYSKSYFGSTGNIQGLEVGDQASTGAFFFYFILDL